MGMRMGLSQRQEQRQEQGLTLEQRQANNLQLRLWLTQELSGGGNPENSFRPMAGCPSCKRGLSAAEILKGFTADPADMTTECPDCKERFEARLVNHSGLGSMSVRFYCREQTLAAIRGLKDAGPDEIKRRDLGLFQSALAHFGSLANAFAKIGVEYSITSIPNWQDKVVPFLGQAPDSMIAEIVGVSKTTIRRWRRKRFIPRYYQPEY